MLLRKALAVLVGLVVFGPPVMAQTGMTDLIPQRAAAALTIRNLDELKKKGDQFAKECDLNLGLRPSDLFAMVYQFLGIQGGIDESGPAAIILMAPEKKDESIGLGNLEELLLGAIPVADLDKLAANFEIKPGTLKPNQITPAKGVNFVRFVMPRGKHLYVASSKRALERVAEQKTVAAELSKDQVKAWNEADLLVHLGANEWPLEREEFVQRLGVMLKASDDPDELRILEQLIAALQHVRFAVGAVRLDNGFGLEITTLFEADHRPTQKFLRSLQPRPGVAHLEGLPEGRVVIAQASHGEGDKTGLLAKALLSHLLSEVKEVQPFFSVADRPNYVGVFSEVWRRLHGHRAAVYLTGDESRLGLFSMLAILDTQDAPKFIADMRLLSKMAEGKLDLSTNNPEETIDVAKLASDLGSDVYRVRDSATTRLRLLGEPALPYLEKILESADLETSRRAKRLTQQIGAVAAERRKELLLKDPSKMIRPQFTFVPQAETRAGHKIDVVQLKLTGGQKALTAQIKQLLGPEWDRVRVAVHGKQVVVLVGSEVALLDSALDNLKNGKKGLADSPALATFHKQAPPPRMVELHTGLESLLGLIAPDDNALPQARPALTSLSLGLGDGQLQLRIFVPYREVRILKKKGLFVF